MDALSTEGPHPALAGVRAILFDKDGTLLDFDATWGPATASVLGELAGGDAALFDALAASCGFLPATLEFTLDSPIIGGHAGEFLPGWAALIGRPCDADFERRVLDLYRDASLASLTGYDDVATTLAELRRRGFAIGLATNDAKAIAKAHLQRLEVAHLFDFVAGFDSGFGAKPEPGMVHAFGRAVDHEPSAVALVGDSPHDMRAAGSAGAVPVGIARTDRARVALGDLPVVVVPDLAALLRALGTDG